MGKLRAESLCKLPLDKLLGLWYNGSSARLDRWRAVETFIIPHSFGFVNRKNEQKMRGFSPLILYS